MLKEYNSRTSLAKYFEVSTKTIQRWEKEGLAAHRKGRLVYYTKEDIDKFMTSYRYVEV